MKSYWSIAGPSQAPGSACVAFAKYDGSNLRFAWSPKRGWHQFGTRHTTFDATDPRWGHAVPQFLNTLAEGVERVFRDRPAYRKIEEATVYCEHFGPSTFAGLHDDDELKREGQLVLFDVAIHKKGFVLPEAFADDFGGLRSAEVVYRGAFDQRFIEDVREGRYNVGEGVVAKGIDPERRARPQHALWMAKVKTTRWLDELRRRAGGSEFLRRTLAENEAEQSTEARPPAEL